jgi:xanthine/uracil permease
MDTLIHADIFFFVTTIAVVLITALFIVAILYIVRILNDLHYISKVVRTETDHLAEDFEEIRDRLKREGLFSGLANLITGLIGRRRQRSNRNSNKKKKIL